MRLNGQQAAARHPDRVTARQAPATHRRAAACFRRAARRLAPALFAAGLLGPLGAAGLEITDAYSPRNTERPRRKATQFIILHTTEGALKGSLDKIRRNGEAHYVVAPNGQVYRCIARHRIAWHAGRSMWDNLANLDLYSIGIEVVGYHNQAISESQYKALRELLAELKQIYKVPDERILSHSMVAYGVPNRWHSHSHRGRKRCGMQFARNDVRRKLGLKKQPLFDPDVRAGRLVNADPYLAKVLYGTAHEQAEAVTHFTGADAFLISPTRSAWDIARDQYNSASTVYVYPDGTRKHGNEISDWKAMRPGVRVVLGQTQNENEAEGFKVLGRDGDSALDLAGAEHNTARTIYFLTDGRVKQGNELTAAQLRALDRGTKLLVGYIHGGYVTARRSAFDICGEKWDYASTYYRLADGSLRSGDQMDETAIPPRTMVFFRQ
jgi:N-acetylmuramoyl-L-alanine amidase